MPNWITILHERLAHLRVSPVRAGEIAEELAADLEQQYGRAISRGATHDAAFAAAMKELGSEEELARRIREIESWNPPPPGLEPGAPRRGQLLANFWQDVRYGARSLSKSPMFTMVAVLALALGIGANTAVFSAVYGVLFKPLPFPEADRLVWGWGTFSGGNRGSTSPPDFLDYRAQGKSFDGMIASIGGTGFIPMTVTGSGEPVFINGAVVTAGLFELLGGRPVLGRPFTAEEEKKGTDNVVVISEGLWQRRFGSDPQIIGRSLTVNATNRVVVGVMGRDFKYPTGAELWLPLGFGSERNSTRRFHFLRPIARLKAGVSLSQAQTEVDAIGTQLEQQYPDSNKTWRLRLVPLKDVVVGNVRPALLAMMIAVAFVLLIACVNVANLLLARGSGRQREIAIRLALGAARSRIVSQLLAESSILAFASSLAGLFLAYWSIEWIQAAAPTFLPRRQEIRIDAGTLAFTVGASLLTWLLFSLVPALQSLRHVSPSALRESGRTTAGVGRGRLRGALVVAEVALSLVLLVGAGLLLKTFWNLTRVDLGFQPEKLLTTNVSLPAAEYSDTARSSLFFRTLYDKLRAIPGVEAAGGINQAPLMGFNDTYFTIAGRPPQPNGRKLLAQQRIASRDYFAALGSRVIAGRVFSAQDSTTSPKVVMVNDAFARENFPGENPLGRVMTIDMGEPFVAEIVGVVAGARQTVAETPFPEMYLYNEQMPISWNTLLIRTALPPAKLTPAVRAVIREMDPKLPLEEFDTMANIAAAAIAQERFSATLMMGFALVALVLAVVGISGVLSHAVAQRTHEIGVRMALGARRGNVVSMVLADGMKLATIGAAAGIAGALALTRLMQPLLFGVTATDVTTFGAVAALLLAVAAAACWIPARRAAHVDPLIALRHE